MIKNTAPNDVLQSAAADRIAYPYRCAVCGAESWMSLADILRLTNAPVMPCGHRWDHLAYDYMRDPGQAPAHEQAPLQTVS